MATQTLDLALLRSVIRFDLQDSEADLRENLDALRIEVAPLGTDQHLLHFVGNLRDRSGLVPDVILVREHYTALLKAGDRFGSPGIIRLNDVEHANLPFLDRSQFRYALDHYKDKVIGDTLGELMQQALLVLGPNGYTPTPLKGQPRTTLQGPSDAMVFLRSGIELVASRFQSGLIEGSFRLDASQLWTDYVSRKNHPPEYVRLGVKEIDLAHGGLSPGDLALVAGFTGHYKSTFCLNWAYRAVVFQKKNVAIIPTEMRARTLLNRIAVIHTYHPKFRAIKKYEMEEVQYDKWREGKLTVPQEELMQEALDDLQTCADYGQIVYMQPSGPITVLDVRRWAEQQHRKIGLHLLVEDYMGQIDPSGGGSSVREASHMNDMIMQTKKMCESFAGGDGIAVLSPFQTSREGFKEAEKAGGVYTLRALAWANEAERSADFVYTTYSNETMLNAHELQFGNLKSRDRKLLSQQFKLYCNPDAGLIEQQDPQRIYQSKVEPEVITQAASGPPTPGTQAPAAPPPVVV